MRTFSLNETGKGILNLIVNGFFFSDGFENIIFFRLNSWIIHQHLIVKQKNNVKFIQKVKILWIFSKEYTKKSVIFRR